MQDSLKRMEEIRKHFEQYKGQNAVMEISDLPMSEWSITKNMSENEEWYFRHNLIIQNKPFAAFEVDGAENFFMYTDEIVLKRINLRTGEIICFEDCSLDDEFARRAGREFKLLQKSLQSKL